MPSSIICTESIISSIPISRSRAVAPLSPRNLEMVEAAKSKIVDAAAATKTAKETVMVNL